MFRFLFASMIALTFAVAGCSKKAETPKKEAPPAAVAPAKAETTNRSTNLVSTLPSGPMPDDSADTLGPPEEQPVAGAQAHYQAGVKLAQENRLEDSVGEFQKALEIQPGFLNARADLVTVRLRLKRANEAVEVSRKGLESRPQHAGLRYRFALALRMLGIERAQCT